MQELDDIVLLRKYAEHDSEEAFALLVTRHVNLVYSVAFRHVGNAHNAEEITQAVFVILAKKAAQLHHDKALSSWLFQATRLTANNFMRSEMRRQHREQEAYMQSGLNESENEIWPRIAPLLDAAVAGLGEKDRRAIVLRFYEGRNLREVGVVLGASEDAAEKRIKRAVEKLQKFFLKRGVTSTTATLAGAISANSVQAAPMALAKTISAVAIAKGATASGSTLTLIKGALKIMAWTKTKTAIIAGAIIMLTTGAGIVALIAVRSARVAAHPNLQGVWEGVMPPGEGMTKTEDQLAHAGTTQMKLTGTSGAIITGFYIQNDQRIAISNSLPWSVVGTNISQFKFQTFNPEDRITIALVYDGTGVHASRTETLDSKFPWIQGKIENGLIVMKPSN